MDNVPFNYQTSVASAPDPGQLQQNQTQNTDIVSSPEIAVVKFKYEPHKEDELALNEGDKVYVLEKVKDGWWKGEVSGKSGWFPSNYVSEDLDRSSIGSKGDDVSLSSGDDFIHGVVTLYPFQCRNSEELNFDQGESLDIIELLDNDPEWWRARNKEGQVGLVPRNYVQKISDAAPVYSRLPFSNGDNVVVDSEVNSLDNFNEDLLGKEGFHGKLSRAQSERVLENAAEGNFLVQESEAFLEEEDELLKSWCKNLGIHEDSLKDFATMNFIKDFVNKHGGMEVVKQEISHQSSVKGRKGNPPPRGKKSRKTKRKIKNKAASTSTIKVMEEIERSQLEEWENREDALQTGTKPKISSSDQSSSKANNKLSLLPPTQKKIAQNQHEEVVLIDVPHSFEQIKTRCKGTSDRVLEQQNLETPIDHDPVEGYVRPSETVKPEHIGMFKGIQGDHNSSYMDVTLYSMFAFSDIFDAILHYDDTAKIETEIVKDALRRTIVNPLRSFGFVRADHVLRFRGLLSLLSSMEGFITEEKDPEEFIHALLQELLNAKPFLKISQGTYATIESFVYQIFTDKKKYLDIPRVEDLLHVSFLESDLKLSEVPECFIIQLPKYGKEYKPYGWIIPSLEMDISLLIRDSPRPCNMCGKLAFMECRNCTPEYEEDDIIQSYCGECFHTCHKSKKHHQSNPLAIPKPFVQKYHQIAKGIQDDQIASATEHLYEKRLMELFSVVCIETSHYVAFVKTGIGKHAQWVFFDSMADRRGDQHGYNVPNVSHLRDFEKQMRRLDLKDALKRNEELPEYLKRLVSDPYICFYRPLKSGCGISSRGRTRGSLRGMVQNVPSSQREAFMMGTSFSQQNNETLSKSSEESHVGGLHSKYGYSDNSHKRRKPLRMDQSIPKAERERYYERTQNSYSQPSASLLSIPVFFPRRDFIGRQQETDLDVMETDDIPNGPSESQVVYRYPTYSLTAVGAIEGYTRSVAEGVRKSRLECQHPLTHEMDTFHNKCDAPMETEDVPKPLKDLLQTTTRPKISSPDQVKPTANSELSLLSPKQKKIVQSQHEKVVLEDVQIKTRWKGNSDQDIEKQKMRKLMKEEHGLTWAEVDTVLALTEKYELSECIQAVKAVGNNLQRALDYFQECTTCFTHYGMHKLVVIPTCECRICTECFAQNFSVLAKTTTCMYKFSCPACNVPNLEDSDQENYQNYFSLLGPLLKTYLEQKDYELYEVKLARWELMADPNFRWCAHGCSSGFINERQWKKAQCPECKKYQCFDCKKPWLEQHKNISCEKFDVWKKANDPEFQQQGLAAHLKENGINCPKCKMRYELAKGGCMHFKCPQCHHQFCCGCNLPFRTNPACSLLPSCKGKGLHAHHPRDCFYYLRDEDCRDLQQLLQKHKVHYKLTSNVAGYNGERPQVCPVKEQQETPDGLMDATCGKPLKDQCGLCENHYKEYLVGLIHQHNIDPVEVFGVKSLAATLRRNDKKIPLRAMNETNADYCARLRQEVQQLLPLRPRNAQGVAGATYQI